jgi:MFS family permease
MLGSFIAIPIGQLSAGYLADSFGTSTVVLWGAALYAALAVATVSVPSVWNLRRLPTGR